MSLSAAFRALAVAFGSIALFHLAQAAQLVGDGASAGRHLVFTGIDGLVAALLIVRPPVFPALFAVLTGQQIASHGGDLVRAWRDAHVVEWSDLAVLAVMPLTLALLMVDARRRRARPASRQARGS